MSVQIKFSKLILIKANNSHLLIYQFTDINYLLIYEISQTTDCGLFG